MTYLPIFIHIPKAAGSTLRSIIDRQYGKEAMYEGYDWRENLRELEAMPKEKIDHMSIILGHIPYGIHSFFDRPVKYITILRNPVDRIISQYYYIKRWKTHYLHRVITEKNINLKEYAMSALTVELDNGQVRQLASLQSLDEMKTPRVGQAEYDQARENLQTFAIVGNIKRFDETLLLLHQKLGWKKHVYYTRENVRNTETQQISSNENEVREILAERNKYDMALYRYSDEWLDQELAQTNVLGKMAMFNIQNRLYHWYHQRSLPYKDVIANAIYRLSM